MANTGNNNLGINPEIQGKGLENPDRRIFLRDSVIATAGLAAGILSLSAGKSEAQEVKLAAYNPESKLGINYAEIAQNPLDAMLANGEGEWMINAKSEFGEDTQVEWEDNVSLLSKEKVTKGMLRDLMEFTPSLLVSFADIPEGQYPLLKAIGSLTIAQERNEAAQERNEAAQERNEAAQERNEAAQEMLQRAQEIVGVLKG